MFSSSASSGGIGSGTIRMKRERGAQEKRGQRGRVCVNRSENEILGKRERGVCQLVCQAQR